MKYTCSILLVAICLLSLYHSAFAAPSSTLEYLKDGKDVNGAKVYNVDYITMEISPSSPAQRYEVTDNAQITVTQTDVIGQYSFKQPDADNPQSYSLSPMNEYYRIVHVQPISDQLNKYELESVVQFGNPIPPTLTETSPTTAVLNYTIDFEAMYFNQQ